jgi:hypothetical protein
MPTKTWRTDAAAVLEQEGEASQLDIDSLAGLPLATESYVDGQADPLYSAAIVAWWPGAHDHAHAVADAIVTAERGATSATDTDEIDEFWDDARRMRDALPSLVAIMTAAAAVAARVGENDLNAIAGALPAELTERFGNHYWTASVGHGLSKGSRVTIGFDL